MRNIEEALNEHLNEVLKHYKFSQVLGVFLYGSQNYETNLEDSDVDTHVVLLPSFEDICYGKMVSEELVLDNGEHCNVKDFRLYIKMLRKQNINFVETLFTKHYWLNCDYVSFWNKYFYEQREKIARYNPRQTVKSIASQAIHTLAQCRPTNGKKFSNAYRLALFLERYIQGGNYEDCLVLPPQTTTLLKELKSIGLINADDHLLLWDGLLDLRDKADSLELDEENQKAVDENFRKAIESLFKEYFYI